MAGSQEDVVTMIAFIKHVENKPCLWNYTLKTYSRTDVTSLAWKHIAEEMKDTDQNCRDRWKNLRTAFGRSLKPPPSGSGKTKKPYYLAAHLAFLHPYMKGATTSGNATVQEGDHDEESENRHASQIDSDLQQSTDSVVEESLGMPEGTHLDVDSEILQQPHVSKKRKVVTPTHDMDKAFVEWLASKKEERTRKLENESERNDSDWLFLRSLLHDFKKLDDRRKRNLKAKYILQLNEQLNDAEREASSMFSSQCDPSAYSTPHEIHCPNPTTVLSANDVHTVSHTDCLPNNIDTVSHFDCLPNNIDTVSLTVLR